MKVKKLDHVIIATEDLDNALQLWERNVGLKPVHFESYLIEWLLHTFAPAALARTKLCLCGRHPRRAWGCPEVKRAIGTEGEAGRPLYNLA